MAIRGIRGATSSKNSAKEIGRNVLINSNRDADDFPADGIVADGKTI